MALQYSIYTPFRPQLMKRPRSTHKQTESERHAALAATSGAGLSGINPSLFSVISCAAPQMQSPVRLTCSHPSGERWARRLSGTSSISRRAAMARSRYLVFQGMIAVAVVQILAVSAERRFIPRQRSGGEHGCPNLWRCFAVHSKLAQCDLPFPDPIHEFDAGDGDRRPSKSLEHKHWTQTKCDGSMILFDQIVQVL